MTNNHTYKNGFCAAALLTTTLLSSATLADSSVWKVSKGDQQLFIGGTVHALQTQDYPLPIEFDQAYALSEKLVFETDISATENPEFVQSLLSHAQYTDGSTLASYISSETLEKLNTYLQEQGLDINLILPLKVGMVMMILSANEFRQLGKLSDGVDKHFSLRAQADHKVLGSLESIDEQIDYIMDIGIGQEDQAIISMLLDFEHFETKLTDLKIAWRQGDMPSLMDIALADLLKFPKIYQSMLVERNLRWFPQIKNLLETPEIEFVLVGALHLAGKHSLLALLEQEGYLIEAYK